METMIIILAVSAVLGLVLVNTIHFLKRGW